MIEFTPKNLRSFGNAHQDDLFAALQEQATKDGTGSNATTLSDIMETWTRKKGFPLVRVGAIGEKSISLSQVTELVIICRT